MEYQLDIEQQIRNCLFKSDKTAISLIVDSYGEALLGSLERIIKDRSMSEDALQEVLVKIWLQGHTFNRARGSLFTWMLSIARNHALDVVKSKHFKLREREQAVGSTIDLVEEVGDAEPIPDEIDHAYDVDHAMLSLPKEQREVIDFSFYFGYSVSEIATMTNTPLGTVKSRLRLALARLRTHFGQQNDRKST